MERWDSVGEGARSVLTKNGHQMTAMISQILCGKHQWHKSGTPGSNAKRLEDETVAVENMAAE